MNNRIVKGTLFAVGAIAVIGTVSAQAVHSQRLANRLAQLESQQEVQTAPPTADRLQDPWAQVDAEMQRIRAEMNQVFNSAFGRMPVMELDSFPAADQLTLEEQGDNYVVKAQIPGAKVDDIDVNLDGRLVSISSETRSDQKQTADDGKLIEQQVYASSFERALTLPGPVKATGMKTQFDNGVLTITIPKATS